ncbi:hypothetical protein [Labilithrix luteola]|uniref:hypothetical protein n=1 Tax=Labilithrix luteola TaxID=1391654 RepID=UPI0011BAD022|nr:hypothetical protein [Labilithrix luteola]
MNGDNKDEAGFDPNGADLEEDDNPWGDGEGGERTVATTAPAFDSNVPLPITAPPPGARPASAKPAALARPATAIGLGAVPPRVGGAPGTSGAGVARPATLAFESKPAAPTFAAERAAGSQAKAAGLGATRMGTGGAPSTLGPKPGAIPAPSKASPLASTTGIGGVGVAGAVKPANAPNSPGALPLPSKKATMMMGAPVPAPESAAPAAPISGPKAVAAPSSRTPSAVSKVSRFDRVPSLVSEEEADDENPTMAIPSAVAMLAVEAAAQDTRAAITAIPAPPPLSLASTAFADSPYAAVHSPAGHPPVLGQSEPEETTRAVSREELLRHQDAHVVVGGGAEGDESTLAVPSTANSAARAVPLGFAETLGPSMANAESPTVRPLPGQDASASASAPAQARAPGVFAWGREPDPRAEIDPLVASEIYDPLVSQPPASFASSPSASGPLSGQPGPHGMHGMPPPPMPYGTGPTGATGLHGAAPSPSLMQGGMGAMNQAAPMQPNMQPGMQQPMPSIHGIANVSGHGWPSGNMPAHAPPPGPGWMQGPPHGAPQGQLPHGAYDPRAQAAMQARGPAPVGPGVGGGAGGKVSPQLIALVAVGVVCVAIFIVGLVLFFTTKF